MKKAAVNPKTQKAGFVLQRTTQAAGFAPFRTRSKTRAACAACVAVMIAMIAAGCAKKTKPRIAVAPGIGATERGIASWYGYPYHGRRAANGEIYDMERLTAAHRTLPFETWVEVMNLNNDKTVTVRITDRGPFIEGRIIDLSKAAAREIDLIGPGIAPVRIRLVPPPRDAAIAQWREPPPPTATEPAQAPVPPAQPRVQPPPAETSPSPEVPAAQVESSAAQTGMYAVQIGAFRDRDRAERIRLEYERQFGAATLAFRAGASPVWRVLVGREPSIEAANGLLERILERTRPAFVVRLDEPVPAPVRAIP